MIDTTNPNSFGLGMKLEKTTKHKLVYTPIVNGDVSITSLYIDKSSFHGTAPSEIIVTVEPK